MVVVVPGRECTCLWLYLVVSECEGNRGDAEVDGEGKKLPEEETTMKNMKTIKTLKTI